MTTRMLALEPGLYTLNASFAGDSSYLASSTQSVLAVLPKNDKDGDGKGKGGDDGKRDGGRDNGKDREPERGGD